MKRAIVIVLPLCRCCESVLYQTVDPPSTLLPPSRLERVEPAVVLHRDQQYRNHDHGQCEKCDQCVNGSGCHCVSLVCVCVLYQTVDPPSTPRVALGDPRVNGGLENGQRNDDLGGDDDDFHCVSLCVVVVCIPLLYSPRRDCQPLSATIQKSFPESTQHATQYRQSDVGFIQSAPLRTPNHRKAQVV